jgi:hypothetical protein
MKPPKNHTTAAGNRTRISGVASELRHIPLAAIKVDPSVQQRVAGTSRPVVKEYAAAMRDADEFSPPTVFSTDGLAFYLGDGFHRIEAYRLTHPDAHQIACEVHPGNHDAAFFLRAARTRPMDYPAPIRTSARRSWRFLVAQSGPTGVTARSLVSAGSRTRSFLNSATSIWKRYQMKRNSRTRGPPPLPPTGSRTLKAPVLPGLFCLTRRSFVPRHAVHGRRRSAPTAPAAAFRRASRAGR